MGWRPIHRSHLIQEFLANGAAQRLHLERLPAYAPELNPGEGLWQQLKGVELRNLCCVDTRTYAANCVMPRNGCDENRAFSKAASKLLAFRFSCTAQ